VLNVNSPYFRPGFFCVFEKQERLAAIYGVNDITIKFFYCILIYYLWYKISDPLLSCWSIAKVDDFIVRQAGRDRKPGDLLRRGLKLTHIRLIAALADKHQISAAAADLHITQPAASRMLADIEKILEVKLHERHSKGVSLTNYGLAMAQRASKILMELTNIDREIDELKSGVGGVVNIGAVTGPAIGCVIPAIKKARIRYPNISINVQMETSPTLVQELLASRHDFVIARIPGDMNPQLFDVHFMGEETLNILVRQGHPLLRKDHVTLEELRNYDWVLQPEGNLLRRAVNNMFIKFGVPMPDKILNTSSILLTSVMVRQTNAISVAASEIAEFFMDENGMEGVIQTLNIAEKMHIEPYNLLNLRHQTLSPAAQILYAYIRDETAGENQGVWETR